MTRLVGDRAGEAIIRAFLLRAFSFHRLMIGYSNLAKVQKGQFLDQ